MVEKNGIPPCMLVAMTRRRALKSAAVAAGAVTVTACGTLPGEFATAEPTTVALPPQTFSLAAPELAPLSAVGGIAYLKIEESGETVELAIVRSGEDELLAFDHRCPHQDFGIGPAPDVPEGLIGEWLPGERAVRCKWHNSVFREDGAFDQGLSMTQGVSDIAVYPVAFDKDANEATVTFSG